jgi:putative sterol carrier protein
MSGKKALQRFFEIVGEELSETTTTSSSPDVNIQFDIEGAGTWSIVTTQGEGAVYCDARPNPDCTISAHVETLLQIAYGRLKPAMAFLRKQIRLSGNKNVFGCLKVPLQRAGERFRLEWQALAQDSELVIGDLRVAVATVEVNTIATYYCITVGLNSTKWEIKARYSRLRRLHDSIATDIQGLTFPGKLIFHNSTSRESRRSKLDHYFAEVGSRHSSLPPFAQQQLQRFFEVEAHAPQDQQRSGSQDGDDGQSSPLPEAVPMDPEVSDVPGVLLKLVLSDLYKDQRQHIMCQSGFSSPRMQSILQRLHELEKMVVQGAGGFGLEIIAKPWTWAIVRNMAYCLLQIAFFCALLLCVMNTPSSLPPADASSSTITSVPIEFDTAGALAGGTNAAACPAGYAEGGKYGAEAGVAAAMACAKESVGDLLRHQYAQSVNTALHLGEHLKAYAPAAHQFVSTFAIAQSTGASTACAGFPSVNPLPLLYRQYQIFFSSHATPASTASAHEPTTSDVPSAPSSGLSFSECCFRLMAQTATLFAIIVMLTHALAPPAADLEGFSGFRAQARYTLTVSISRAPQLALGAIIASYVHLHGRVFARTIWAWVWAWTRIAALDAAAAVGTPLPSDPNLLTADVVDTITDSGAGAGADISMLGSSSGVSGVWGWWWGASWFHLQLPLLHCFVLLLRSPAFISLPTFIIGAGLRCEHNCRRRRRRGQPRRFALGARLNAYARLVHVYSTTFVAISAYTSLRLWLWFTGKWLNVSINKRRSDAMYSDLDRLVGPFVCAQIVQVRFAIPFMPLPFIPLPFICLPFIPLPFITVCHFPNVSTAAQECVR